MLDSLLALAELSFLFWLGCAMDQQDEKVTTNADGSICVWTRVPNQGTCTGYSWTTPSVVSPAGFSSVVPPNSGHPLDVGWPVWVVGLLLVYSHDGPFGIYGNRIFVPWPKDSGERGPFWLKTLTRQNKSYSLAFCLLPDCGRTFGRKSPCKIRLTGGCCTCTGNPGGATSTLTTKQAEPKKHLGRWLRSTSLSIEFSEPLGAQGNVRPSGRWRISCLTLLVTSGLSVLNALIHEHHSMLSCARMKHARWCMWTMHAFIWRWGKPRCRYLQRDAARAQYVDDVVMQCRWQIWPTNDSVTVHRRRVARHKYHEFTAFQDISALGKFRPMQCDSYYGRAAVRGLKHRYRRARPTARPAGMSGWGRGSWKTKDDRPAKETPSYSSASSSAVPWNPQPQQQQDHSSSSAAASEQWTG